MSNYLCKWRLVIKIHPQSLLPPVHILGHARIHTRVFSIHRRRGRKRAGKTEVPAMVLRSTLKQPERSAHRKPGVRNSVAVTEESQDTCESCSQVSKPPLSPCPVCRHPHWRTLLSEAWAPGIGLSRQSGLKVPGAPHTASCGNSTWGTLGHDNCRDQSVNSS